MMAMMRIVMMRDMRVPMVMMGRPRRRGAAAGHDRGRACQSRHTTFNKSHQIDPLVDILIERVSPESGWPFPNWKRGRNVSDFRLTEGVFVRCANSTLSDAARPQVCLTSDIHERLVAA